MPTPEDPTLPLSLPINPETLDQALRLELEIQHLKANNNARAQSQLQPAQVSRATGQRPPGTHSPAVSTEAAVPKASTAPGGQNHHKTTTQSSAALHTPAKSRKKQKSRRCNLL